MKRPSREAGAVARRVGGTLQRLPGPVRYVVSGAFDILRVPILDVLVIAIAITVFVPTTLAFEVARMVFGNPTGPIAVVLGLTWLGGSFALWFVLIVRAYRAIPIVAFLMSREIGGENQPDEQPARSDASDQTAFDARIAAADARFAPPREDPEVRPGASAPG